MSTANLRKFRKNKSISETPTIGGRAGGHIPFPPLEGHIVWQDGLIQKNRLRGTTPVDGQRKESILL